MKQYIRLVSQVLKTFRPGKVGFALLLVTVTALLAVNVPQVRDVLQLSQGRFTENGQTDPEKDPLKAEIERAYPQMANLKISDWDKVNLLRRWAYRTINVSSSSCLLENRLQSNFYKTTATELYNLFNQESNGVWCAGSAFFLVRLYNHYGYEAYVLSVGQQKDGSTELLTHSVTLVKIQHQGQSLYSIQDAYANATFTTTSGSPLDWFNLLTVLNQKADQQIQVVQDDDGMRDVIFCSGENYPPPSFYGTPTDKVPCEKRANGNVHCQYRLTLEDLTDRHPLSAPTQQFLAKAGYKPNLLYMFLFPYGLNDGNSENQALLDQAKSMVRKPI
ncbi:hypothetical protein ACN4EK_26985 [Pantanalinema rosaneae CENA516]|uniref:hypothetical protein n=1 Tax=Pantanalinema rosaneae TaxID=1620701 RepID=UPI003D6DC280